MWTSVREEGMQDETALPVDEHFLITVNLTSEFVSCRLCEVVSFVIVILLENVCQCDL